MFLPSARNRQALCVLCLSAASFGAAEIGGGYVHKEPGSIRFMRLTRVGNGLSGFMEVVSSDYSKPFGTSVKSAEFVGSCSGGSFALFGDTISRLFGGTIVRTSGTVRGKGLRLSYPSSSGFVVVEDYSPCGEAQWNASLDEFKKNHYLRGQLNTLMESLGKKLSQHVELDAKIRTWLSEASQKTDRAKERLQEILAKAQAGNAAMTRLKTAIELAKEQLARAEEYQAEAERRNDANPTTANSERFREAQQLASDKYQTVIDLENRKVRADDYLSSLADSMKTLQEESAQLEANIVEVRKQAGLRKLEVALYTKAMPRLSEDVAAGRVTLSGLPPGAVVRSLPGEASRSMDVARFAYFPILNVGSGWSLMLLQNRRVGWVRTNDLTQPKTYSTHP